MPGFGSRGFTIIEVMVVVLILALLALIAVPGYARFQARARQGEVKVNLGAIYVAEMAFHANAHRFSSFSDIGFQIEGQTNRYTYRSAETDSDGFPTGTVQTIPSKTGSITPENSAFPAASAAGTFTATATGNIDSDPTIEEWHVTDFSQDVTRPDMDDVGQ